MTQILSLESTVASLDLCRRLVELGAPAGTRYVWAQTFSGSWQATPRSIMHDGTTAIPAYSTDELLRLMPDGFKLIALDETSPRWWAVEGDHDPAATPADALAVALIEMAESGVVTFDTINHGG
jgi:hypothetical protein